MTGKEAIANDRPQDDFPTQLGTPVPLSVLFQGAITQASQGRNEPLDHDEIRKLADDLALLAEPADERPLLAREQQIDPQTPGTITGYRTTTQDAVNAVNMIKQMENELGDFITKLRFSYGAEPVQDVQVEVDDDLAVRAIETLQVGFMLLVRSIFQPDSKLKP